MKTRHFKSAVRLGGHSSCLYLAINEIKTVTTLNVKAQKHQTDTSGDCGVASHCKLLGQKNCFN